MDNIIKKIAKTINEDPDYVSQLQNMGQAPDVRMGSSSDAAQELDRVPADLGEEGGPIRPEPQKEKEISTRSKLDTTIAIDVISILKRLLASINCQLKDWHVKYHNLGFDITNIRIFPQDMRELRQQVDKESLRQFRDKPTALAMVAINVEFKQAIMDELALDARCFAYDKADIASITVMEPPPEQPMDDFAAVAPDLEAMAQNPEGMGGEEEMGMEEPLPEEGEEEEEFPEGEEELGAEGEEGEEGEEEELEGEEEEDDLLKQLDALL